MRRSSIILLVLLALGIVPVAVPRVARSFDPANIDTGVNPCEDFYGYAVGAWDKRTAIPPEYAKYGVDQEVDARAFALLKDIVEDAARDTSAVKGSERQKVGDFFAAGMDEARIEEEGGRPLEPLLARIAAVQDRRALAAEIASLQEIGVGAAFRLDVGPDDRNSARNILQLSQQGLGLPERDYYLKQDAHSKRLRREYVAHVERMFRLLGDVAPAANGNAQAVMRLETRLARASITREQAEDPIAIYHKMSRSSLAKRAPGFAWDAYFGALGLHSVKTLLVRQPTFFREFGRMAEDVPLADWRSYLRWHLLRATAAYLSAPFAHEAFAFNGTILEGIEVLSPRWKRVLTETDIALGEAVSKLYVERAFSSPAKAKALDLVANLRAALRARIQRLGWLSESAKTHALAKIDAMRVKIGYPDVWRNYDGLDITRASYLNNVLEARSFAFRRSLSKVGKAVDHTEWPITPITNNAYYEPTLNELVFPAAILQPPFFDPEADDAANYGSIGSTIGHELSHGFDEWGRKYDAQGNIRNWWSAADVKAYRQRTARLVKQFDAFEPLPGAHINGTLTLGENLADLAGLIIAYEAFRRSQDGKAAPPKDQFTPEQRFFLSYAETWRFKLRDEALRARLLTDEHAPPKYRVLGPLANMQEFAAAFKCKAGDAMVRPAEERPNNW